MWRHTHFVSSILNYTLYTMQNTFTHTHKCAHINTCKHTYTIHTQINVQLTLYVLLFDIYVYIIYESKYILFIVFVVVFDINVKV